MAMWKWHSHLKEEMKKPALLKQNDIYGMFSLCEFCVRESALKGKMTVVSSAEGSLAQRYVAMQQGFQKYVQHQGHISASVSTGLAGTDDC